MQDPLITIKEDCEFLVSDNASTHETPEVVFKIADPRARYFQFPSQDSMNSKYGLTISHARGKYINFLGDDDGKRHIGTP